ncbi:MAG: GTPase ObgE [Bacteroidales bacterium]|nr:GTPase ObgE [Bacteroidales bacterium]
MAESNFIDYVKIFCASGHGGAGSMHLHRAKYVPKGGPDGGDGGRGGHVILRANPQFWTLIHLKYRKVVRAASGEPGGAALCKGKQGEDVLLDVPVGTVVKDAESGEVLFEMVTPGENRILCQGGRGGWGNDHFKSPTNQTPRYSQPGEEGQEGWFILELKVLADVGLVGFPNAGKSTLLAAVTSAKPKIANYAFTTLEPNLGIVKYYDDRSFVMADIPGIIEGAHEGKGIGLRFLRHIERNSVLLFMVSAEEENVNASYKILLKELKEYNPELLVKDRILAVTKCDLADEVARKQIAKHLPKSVPTVMISSVTGEGLSELKDLLWDALTREA